MRLCSCVWFGFMVSLRYFILNVYISSKAIRNTGFQSINKWLAMVRGHDLEDVQTGQDQLLHCVTLMSSRFFKRGVSKDMKYVIWQSSCCTGFLCILFLVVLCKIGIKIHCCDSSTLHYLLYHCLDHPRMNITQYSLFSWLLWGTMFSCSVFTLYYDVIVLHC